MSPGPGFVVAAVLLVALAAAHSYLGERYILIRLFRRPLPPLFGDDSFTRETLRFVWHALTVVWVALGVLLVVVPVGGKVVVGYAVAAALLATALLTVIISKGRHLSWVVELGAVAAIVVELAGLA